MATIVIDAGHGGSDSGALGKRSNEKDLNLRDALLLRDILQRCGFRTVLTRETDVFVGLTKRAEIAAQHNADLFISTHKNGAASTNALGPETFYSINRPDDKAIATHISNCIAKILSCTSRGGKIKPSSYSPQEDYFTIINQAAKRGVPHIFLVEIDFITTESREILMLKNKVAEEYCEVIANIIKELLPSKNHVNFLIGGVKKEVEGYISNGTTYVKARHLLESMGKKVSFIDESKTVVVDM